MLALLMALAFASPAGAADLRVAHVEPLGTSVPDLAISSDGRWVAALDEGSNELRILDTWSWNVDAYSACGGEGVGGLAAYETGDGLVRFYVGCESGNLTWAETTGDAWALASETVQLDALAVRGIAVYDDMVYAVAEHPDQGNPQVHEYDPSTATVTADSAYPATLGNKGYEDCDISGSLLIVSQGSDNVSKVDLSTGSASIADGTLGSADGSDIVVGSNARVFIAAGDQGVMEFEVGDNDVSLVISSGDGLEDARAVAIDADESTFLVADASRGEFVTFAYSGVPGDVEQDAIAFPGDGAAASTPVEMVTLDGYAVGGTDGGELWILTDRPWVEASTPNPSSALDGDTVSLGFTCDTAGDWTLLIGADGDSGGTELASGTISAGGTETATFTVDASFSEGANVLRLVVEDADGLLGHDATRLTVDNPPEQVSFTEENVGFGNSLLSVSFQGLDAEDIETYTVYITATPFSADDWETGGPEFDGDDAIDTPIEISAGEPGATVSTEISPLTNGVTYYLAVRATDSGGLEGPMSDVVSATPLETMSASQLAGEEGGPCGTAAPVTGWLAVLGGLVAVARRRRGGAGLLLGVLGLGLVAASPARADEGDLGGVDDIKAARAARKGTFSIRYGPIWLEDETINAVFNQGGHQVLQVEAGPSIIEQLDVTLGFGFYQELGYMLAEDGSQSSEHDMLTAFPFSLNVAFQADFFKEQVLVPSASMGADYWLWKENWYINPDVGGTGQVIGGKLGWHWVLGAHLLLDSIEPSRASKLQTRTGIDDSYLTVDYRGQDVGSFQEGFSFSGEALTFGLRLNY